MLLWQKKEQEGIAKMDEKGGFANTYIKLDKKYSEGCQFMQPWLKYTAEIVKRMENYKSDAESGRRFGSKVQRAKPRNWKK